MDYFIIAVTTCSGLYFHWWLLRRIRRWSDRDLALSHAQGDPDKRRYMLAALDDARRQRVARKALADWLQARAADYRAP